MFSQYIYQSMNEWDLSAFQFIGLNIHMFKVILVKSTRYGIRETRIRLCQFSACLNSFLNSTSCFSCSSSVYIQAASSTRYLVQSLHFSIFFTAILAATLAASRISATLAAPQYGMFPLHSQLLPLLPELLTESLLCQLFVTGAAPRVS